MLVDAKLLVYAKFSDFPQNTVARHWLTDSLNTTGKIGIPWQSSLAFLRLATNARLFDHPMTIETAWEQVAEWLTCPGVWVPEPTEDHDSVLGRQLKAAQATGNLVPDAHLAAIAVEHGLKLFSADSDFARIPEVDWVNPLLTS